jgi:3alpha(or 20beta)-hydroxysteroid dehydrogenase
MKEETMSAPAEDLGPAATYVHLDVTNRALWEVAVDAAVAAYGRLDVLVNNVGISIPGRIDEYSHAVWDKVVAIQLLGEGKIPGRAVMTPNG